MKATDRGGEETTGKERSGASAPARNNADKLRWPSVQENQPNPKRTPRVRLDESPNETARETLVQDHVRPYCYLTRWGTRSKDSVFAKSQSPRAKSNRKILSNFFI